jgi:hypothetical protein
VAGAGAAAVVVVDTTCDTCGMEDDEGAVQCDGCDAFIHYICAAGRCRLTASKPVLKVPVVSAFDTIIS